MGKSRWDMLSLLFAHKWIKNENETRSYDITDRPAVTHLVHRPKFLLPLYPVQQYSPCLPPAISSFQTIQFSFYFTSLFSPFQLFFYFLSSVALFISSSLPLSLAVSLWLDRIGANKHSHKKDTGLGLETLSRPRYVNSPTTHTDLNRCVCWYSV